MRTIRLLSWLSLIAFAARCGGGASELGAADTSASTTSAGITDPSPGYSLAKNVVVLDDITAKAAVVDADNVYLPLTSGQDPVSAIKAGGYIVSGEGDGFLRRVVSVARVSGVAAIAGDALRVSTVSAALTEIVINGKIDVRIQLDPMSVDLSGQTSVGTEQFGFSVTPLTFFMQPTIELKLEIKNSQVYSFQTTLQLENITTMGAQLKFNQARAFDTGDIDVWHSPKWRFVQMIGPIPVVEVVSFGIATGARANVSAKAQATIAAACTRTQTMTLLYMNGAWSETQAAEGSCVAPDPTYSAQLTASAYDYLKGTLGLAFYGVAGPYLTAEDGLQASLVTCPSKGHFDLSSPATVKLGADLSKLGGKTYEVTLLQKTLPIGSWQFDTAAVCGQ